LTLTITSNNFYCTTETGLGVDDDVACAGITSTADDCYEAVVEAYLYVDSPNYSKAGAFYIKEATLVTATGNNYAYCYICQEGAVYTLVDTTFSETSGTYGHNAAINGGAIKCDGGTFGISSSTFADHGAISGGTFFFDNQVQATIDNTQITTSTAYEDGGAIAISQSSLETPADGDEAPTLAITDCDILQYNYAGSEGGFAYISNSFIEVSMTTSKITDTGAYDMSPNPEVLESGDTEILYATHCMRPHDWDDVADEVFDPDDCGITYGGVFSVKEAAALSIADSEIKNTDAVVSQILYSTSAEILITIKTTEVICNDTFTAYEALEWEYLDQTTPITFTTNAFQIESAVSVTSSLNSFSQCGIGERGGLFRLVETTFTDTTSDYFENAASSGGVISC
jgi:hypothetical protein